MSFWYNPTEAAKNAVIAPVIIMIVKAISDCSINGEHLINKYTPAVHFVGYTFNKNIFIKCITRHYFHNASDYFFNKPRTNIFGLLYYV